MDARSDRGPPPDAHRHRQDHLSSSQPSAGPAAEGWSLNQIARDIPLTPSARDVLETGQRVAAQAGAARVEPQHLLAAIAVLRRNPAHRALSELGADLEQLEEVTRAAGRPAAASPSTVPIGSATRYLLNNAHREAEQLGHYRVDALHLLLALLYKDSPATAQKLEAAGLTIYAMRQHLTAPASTPKEARRRPLPSLGGVVGISPI